jgi:hypothetical protein
LAVIATTGALILTGLLVALGLRDGREAPATGPGCPSPRSGQAARVGQLNESLAMIARRRFDSCPGDRSLVASYAGSHGAPASSTDAVYARRVLATDWGPGQTLRYGADLYLPPGFHDALGGQVALMRWDNYDLLGSRMNVGGIVVDESDGRARLVRDSLAAPPQAALTEAFALPEGSWFRLDVIQRRPGAGARAHSSVRLDGRPVAGSRERVSYLPTPARKVRFGLVAVSPDQDAELAVWLDHPSVSVSGP